MKEFALKHPFLTFFMVDATITGVLKIVAMLTGNFRIGNAKTGETTTNEEDSEDESANDIQ